MFDPHHANTCCRLLSSTTSIGRCIGAVRELTVWQVCTHTVGVVTWFNKRGLDDRCNMSYYMFKDAWPTLLDKSEKTVSKSSWIGVVWHWQKMFEKKARLMHNLVECLELIYACKYFLLPSCSCGRGWITYQGKVLTTAAGVWIEKKIFPVILFISRHLVYYIANTKANI